MQRGGNHRVNSGFAGARQEPVARQCGRRICRRRRCNGARGCRPAIARAARGETGTNNSDEEQSADLACTHRTHRQFYDLCEQRSTPMQLKDRPLVTKRTDLPRRARRAGPSRKVALVSHRAAARSAWLLAIAGLASPLPPASRGVPKAGSGPQPWYRPRPDRVGAEDRSLHGEYRRSGSGLQAEALATSR